MTITFRPLPRCDRCTSPHRPACDDLRRRISELVTEEATAAVQEGRRTIDADLVLDCRSYDWRRPGERGRPLPQSGLAGMVQPSSLD